MSPDATLLSAVAAIAAAVLSGLSLLILGRRDERRWQREALLDAYSRYANVSFLHTRQARRAIVARRARADTSKVDDLASEAYKARLEATEALTQIRLLAPAAVILAAERLRLSDRLLLEAAFAERYQTPSPDAIVSIEQEWQGNRKAKEEFFDSVRISLGLMANTQIDERFWRPIDAPRPLDP